MPATPFHEKQFPPQISYGAKGGPEFNTTVVEAGGGGEQRNVNWQNARGRWTVGHNLKNTTDIKTLITFYRTVYGRAYGFRFKDWTDYQGVAETIGTGDATTNQFQLVRNYMDAIGQVYVRKISKPVNGTVNIYLGGVLQGSGWSVDPTTGIITFVTPPGDTVVITADFEFDVPARFNTDRMDIDIMAFNVHNWEGVEIVELKL